MQRRGFLGMLLAAVFPWRPKLPWAGPITPKIVHDVSLDILHFSPTASPLRMLVSKRVGDVRYDWLEKGEWKRADA